VICHDELAVIAVAISCTRPGRAAVGSFARDLEAPSTSRATVTRRLRAIAGFRYAVGEELLQHSPAGSSHVLWSDEEIETAVWRVSVNVAGMQRAVVVTTPESVPAR